MRAFSLLAAQMNFAPVLSLMCFLGFKPVVCCPFVAHPSGFPGSKPLSSLQKNEVRWLLQHTHTHSVTQTDHVIFFWLRLQPGLSRLYSASAASTGGTVTQFTLTLGLPRVFLKLISLRCHAGVCLPLVVLRFML